MKELQVFTHGNVDVLDSRLVAQIVEKEHRHLMRDIKGYIEHLSTESKIGLSDFFIESTYKDRTGRMLPCYLITRKGCEFIANKLTGKKGTLFTASYINAFHEYEAALSEVVAKTPIKESLTDKTKEVLAEAKLRNARAREASVWLKISAVAQGATYKQVCASYASAVLTGGERALPLPVGEEKHLTATEVGQMFGVSAKQIGSIANANGLKCDAYGKVFHDKSRYSAKEVESFRYNAAGVTWFENYFTKEGN